MWFDIVRERWLRQDMSHYFLKYFIIQFLASHLYFSALIPALHEGSPPQKIVRSWVELQEALQGNINQLLIAPNVFNFSSGALDVTVPMELRGLVGDENSIPTFDCEGAGHGALIMLAGGFLITVRSPG